MTPVKFDLDNHRPDECDHYPWCKIHWYWSFVHDMHVRYPVSCRYLSSRNGWVEIWVYCGPPAYYPAKPKPDQWEDMRRNCPHQQMRIDCNNCLRHTFHPFEV